jgi:hypothetical protein
MILIKNKGQALISTNYWDSEAATEGAFYLSWNAGAARLLVPDSQKPLIKEMKGAREVIISRGPWRDQGLLDALELLWEDGSDEPFCLFLSPQQTDRLISAEDQGGGITVIVYTRSGEKGRWPARYRIVPEIPWLKPWSSH